MSLRTRLLVGMALVAVALVVAGALLALSTRARLLDQVDAQLEAVGLPASAVGIGEEGGTSSSPVYIGLVQGDRLVAVARPEADDDADTRPAIPPARLTSTDPRPFTVASEGGGQRFRVRVVQDFVGVTLVLGAPLGEIDATVAGLIRTEAALIGAALLVLAVVTWWVLRLGVRPVNRMTEAAVAIADGDRSWRLPVADDGDGTEVARLGRALNRMLTTIEDAFALRTESEARLRRFVADASHELGTPLTTIRGYAELGRVGGLDDPAAFAEAMRRTEEEAVRMGRLIEDLLQLARLDAGEPTERRPVDLAALVEDAAADARAVQPGRAVDVAVDRSAGAPVVLGDEGRLRQVVGNLVRNALVHTPVETGLELRAATEPADVGGGGPRVVLEVVDHGPGMDAEATTHAFERFWRAETSRSRERGGGSGLGLAIVAAAVQAHDGTVTLESAPGRGTTARVVLPAAASAPSPVVGLPPRAAV